jgi:hypothetical protein
MLSLSLSFIICDKALATYASAKAISNQFGEMMGYIMM